LISLARVSQRRHFDHSIRARVLALMHHCGHGRKTFLVPTIHPHSRGCFAFRIIQKRYDVCWSSGAEQNRFVHLSPLDGASLALLAARTTCHHRWRSIGFGFHRLLLHLDRQERHPRHKCYQFIMASFNSVALLTYESATSPF